MINKGAKLYSIVCYKCPRCHESNLFKSNTYDLKHFTEMPEQCGCCGQRFKLEPAFYSGDIAKYTVKLIYIALTIVVYKRERTWIKRLNLTEKE